VSLRTAKLCKSHTVAENIILSAAADRVKTVIESKDTKQIEHFSLSKNTVYRIIDDMADDVLWQLI
jgi:hypothetical protein